MSSNSKRQKLYEEPNGMHFEDVIDPSFPVRFEDRLTNLPCSLKTKILSCLPTKEAVKTSILSTNWTTTWTSVNNLDFDDQLIRYRDNKLLRHDFINFVDRVLLLHDKSCLERFSIKCSERYGESVINSWIAAALLFNIREIDLSVPMFGAPLLPSNVFICKTLVVLDLHVRCQLNRSASVCLPVLKTLHLSDVELSDDDSIIRLLSGCPVLEDLQLNRCIGKDVRIINITSSSLTSLTMDNLPYLHNPSKLTVLDYFRYLRKYRYQIIIDTPALKYLNISDDKAQGYSMKGLNHLVKVDINTGAINGFGSDGGRNPITDIFNVISQVQSLNMSHLTMEAICSSGLVLPCFRDLKFLKLDTSSYHNVAYFNAWSCLHKLLESSPCLETLHLQLGSSYEAFPSDYLTDVSPCSLFHLKVINIVGFEGLESEIAMVEYFLENGKALEKLTIDYKSYSTKGDATFQKQLQMMPRSSAVCQVEVL